VSATGPKRLITSEIGATAVAIVDRTANLELAAQEILKSKIAFSSSGPYTPLAILVNEFVEGEFMNLLCEQAAMNSSKSMNGIVAHHSKMGSEKTVSENDVEIAMESHRVRLTRLAHRFVA
jgi:acyl-CoA reductase-like NAD-dependent aldehyde dehydrogenase